MSGASRKQRACFSRILSSLKDADGALITVPSIAMARWDGKVNEIRAMRETDLPRAEQIALELLAELGQIRVRAVPAAPVALAVHFAFF